jgi:lysophospholipase L1-like esterase
MPGKKVWMFGGSAVWGTGVEWTETMPSYLAKYGYDVTNYGETGYVSTQQLILLIQELKTDTPDIVIFYDGFNDIYSAYQQGVAGLPMNEFNRAKEFNLSKKWLGAYLKAKFQRQEHEFNLDCVNDVISNYMKNIRVAQALAREYGFKFYYFWQDYSIEDDGDIFEYYDFFGEVYGIASDFDIVLRINFRYFIDQCHLNSEGNEIIAARIHDNIK